MVSVKWGEHTGAELAAAAKTNALVILPLGCTEQHGPHLPVDTDTYQVERMAVEGSAQAAEKYGINVLVLPTIPYGPASEHYGYPGTVSLPNEVYLQLVKHLLWSVIELGFRRLAVVRGCGGHWIIPGVVWDLKADARRAGYAVTLRVMVTDEGRALIEKLGPPGGGGHAGVMETALCLAEREALVHQEKMRAPDLKLLNERYRIGGEAFLFDEISDTGGLGDPRSATGEMGRVMWQARIDGFAEKIKYLQDQDRELNRL